MSMATRTDTQPPAPHIADSRGLIRVQGARENNLKDVSVEIPKRRLTVFTGVSGSGKSSLVFNTIAAESQRLINETYSAFVQGFMPTLARPEVDLLEGLTTAIIVDQERMGANPRSTVGTATDANAMLRILFSRIGKPHIGSPNAYSFNVPSVRASGGFTVERGPGRTRTEAVSFTRTGGMCPRCEGMGTVSDIDLTQLFDDSKSLAEGAITIPGYKVDSWWTTGIFIESGFLDPNKPIRKFTKKELQDFLHKEPTKVKVKGVNLTYEGLIPSPIVERMGPPISKVPWSPEMVAQSLEILPIGLRDGTLFWLRPVHAPSLRVGISKSVEPSQFVQEVVAWYPLSARVVHSTSWRYEEGRIILTYVVVVDPPRELPPSSLEMFLVERSDLARGDSLAPPESITVAAVLEHAIRHLAWLIRDDPMIAAALAEWSPALDCYRPEPFRA